MSFLLSPSTKSEKRMEQVLPGSGERRRKSEEVAQTMYIHVSKCKNDQMKERNKCVLRCFS
jgi:hypothetical protein